MAEVTLKTTKSLQKQENLTDISITYL